jgi:ribosome-associated translation inhibitor RaiA
MDLPLQITWRGVARSEGLEAAIRDKAAKLQQFYERIARCKVVVELSGRHKNQGNPYAVRVELKLPGSEITASAEHAEDAHVAVRDAFEAARRRLQDFAREHRDAA